MISVRLGEERERRLRRAATLSGRKVADIVRDALDRHLGDLQAEQGETLDVMLGDFVGCVRGNGRYQARDAERALGEILAEKRQKGRL